MNCREVEDRIQNLLDDRSPLDDDPVLRSHTQHCEACRRKIGEYTMLFGRQADVLSFVDPSRVTTNLAGPARLPWMRIAKVLVAVAAVVVLFVQPVIWGWQRWEHSPQLAAGDSLAREVVEANLTGKANDVSLPPLTQAQDRSEINVASILDFSDAFSGIDLSGFNAAEIPVVRPLAKPMNVSWNRLMQSVPNLGGPAAMHSEQMQKMHLDSNQLQMLLHSWSRIFS